MQQIRALFDECLNTVTRAPTAADRLSATRPGVGPPRVVGPSSAIASVGSWASLTDVWAPRPPDRAEGLVGGLTVNSSRNEPSSGGRG